MPWCCQLVVLVGNNPQYWRKLFTEFGNRVNWSTTERNEGKQNKCSTTAPRTTKCGAGNTHGSWIDHDFTKSWKRYDIFDDQRNNVIIATFSDSDTILGYLLQKRAFSVHYPQNGCEGFFHITYEMFVYKPKSCNLKKHSVKINV